MPGYAWTNPSHKRLTKCPSFELLGRLMLSQALRSLRVIRGIQATESVTGNIMGTFGTPLHGLAADPTIKFGIVA